MTAAIALAGALIEVDLRALLSSSRKVEAAYG